MVIREKVVAYITHVDPVSGGTRLLVFSQPSAPEAGIQVPAGTVQPGEPPEIAAAREAREETGLTDLELVQALGERTFDMRPWGKSEIHHRRFFHLRCHDETPPDRWEHTEPDPDGGDGASDPSPIVFALSWVPFPDGVPDLIGGQGALLAALTAES